MIIESTIEAGGTSLGPSPPSLFICDNRGTMPLPRYVPIRIRYVQFTLKVREPRIAGTRWIGIGAGAFLYKVGVFGPLVP
jgi:hypothetical protein